MDLFIRPDRDNTLAKQDIMNIISKNKITNHSEKEAFGDKLLSIITSIDGYCKLDMLSIYSTGKAYGFEYKISENFDYKSFFSDTEISLPMKPDTDAELYKNGNDYIYTMRINPSNKYIFMNGYLSSLLLIWYCLLGFYDSVTNDSELRDFEMKTSLIYKFICKVLEQM
jgi:hypothetical protein